MTERLPPHDDDAEEAVVGSILIDPEAIVQVADFLKPEDFYRQHLGLVYEAMIALYERSETLDIVTVREELERSGDLDRAGGSTTLSKAAIATPTSVHVEQYARIVERKASMRHLISAGSKIAGIGYGDPPDTQSAINDAMGTLMAATERRVRSQFSSLGSLLHDEQDRLEMLHENRGETLGIPSGLADLDRITNGFMPGDLVVLAGRPGTGKSALMLNVAKVAAAAGKSVGIFSCEMPKHQLTIRLIASSALVDSRNIQNGFLGEEDYARLAAAMNSLYQASIFVDDTPAISPIEARTKSRRLRAEQGLDLVIVDYLQLMTPPRRSRDANRAQEVAEISASLKALAREMEVPVLALASLNRAPDARENREPRLSDLRESGAIESDADLVIFLWRESDKTSMDGQDLVKVKVAKHRNGPTGDAEVWFRGAYTQFIDMAHRDY